MASAPPQLAVAITNGVLQLSWPATHLGWILQAQTNPLPLGLTMPTNAWRDLTNTVALTNLTHAIDPATPTAFFRLRRP
jgi:hypothetical protein